MTPKPTNLIGPRHRCPECDQVLAALSERVGEAAKYQPYVDPADGAAMYRCRIHGRIAVQPDGSGRLEADPASRRRVSMSRRL